MAEEKRTTVIDFQVTEADVISSLANTKKAIIDTKQAQAELNKAYKDGAVSLDHYAKESVQLEASLKKQQASYSTLQRTVTGLKNPFDKLNESIKQQAQNVTVAGVSLSTFANPATATIGILGALFKAYGSSSAGAKDLTFASNQLNAILQITTNSFGDLISSAEDGQGFFTKFLNTFLAMRGANGLAALSKEIAMLAEEMEDLGRKRLSVLAENNARGKENIDIMEKLADSQVSFNEKQELGVKAITNLTLNRNALLEIANRELELLNKGLTVAKDKDEVTRQIKAKELEISEIMNDRDRAVSRIEKAESNILDVKNKQAKAEQENAEKAREKQLEADRKYEDEIIKLELDHDIREAERRQAELDADAAHKENMLAGMRSWLKKSEELVEKNKKHYEKVEKDKTKISFLEQQNRLATASYVIGQVANLIDKGSAAYKFLAIAQATVDTYRAATAALAPPPVGAGPLFGPILAGTTIALGFANIAKIASAGDVGAAAGGGSFYTKGPQLLMVGDNPGGVEMVDVHPVSGRGKTVVGKNMVAMAGGGSMVTNPFSGLSAMGIDYGTMVGGSSGQGGQTIKVTMNYSEFKEFENGIHYKESVATA